MDNSNDDTINKTIEDTKNFIALYMNENSSDEYKLKFKTDLANLGMIYFSAGFDSCLDAFKAPEIPKGKLNGD